MKKIFVVILVLFNCAYADDGVLGFFNNIANVVVGDYKNNQIDSSVTRSDGWVIYNYSDGSNGRKKVLCQDQPQ